MIRIVYLTATVILGLLFSFFIHYSIEIFVLKYVVPDIRWQTWQTAHDVGSIILPIIGFIGGIRMGLYWIRHYPLWSYIGLSARTRIR